MNYEKIISRLSDLAVLPVAGSLCLISLYKQYTGTNFDPDQNVINTCIQNGETPILLIHGSGFNETQWLFGRYLLQKDGINLVFSLNYDGIIGDDESKGVDDFATNEIRRKVLDIKNKTRSNSIILIGHSMGGLIASYYAEYVSHADNVQVVKVVAIQTPFNGSDLLDYIFDSAPSFIVKRLATSRNIHMSRHGLEFRDELLDKMSNSNTKYYSIWSENDYAVTGNSGCIKFNPENQFQCDYLGHYSSMLSPKMWHQIVIWISN